MPRSRKYKKYDPLVKAAVAMTGCENLFPHLEIPRMTALHWIKNGCESITDPIHESLVSAINESKEEARDLQNKLFEKEAIIALLIETYKAMSFEIRWNVVRLFQLFHFLTKPSDFLF
jgi:hypothetical protein